MAEMFSEDFANWLLGTPINLTELKPTELSLEPIRADSLIFLESDNVVLHLEFQTGPDETLPFRMADYRLRVYRRFPQKEMYQVVIYLRKNNTELVRQTLFTAGKLRHEFDVIRLWEQPTEFFLDKPGLLPFAVLTQTDQPVEVLSQVGAVIGEISDRRKQSNVAASTYILAGLVLDQETITRILRSDIMRESVTYQEILAEGKAEGKAEGIQQGKQEAIHLVALNLLREGMAIEQVAKVTELSMEEVEVLHRQINSQD